MSDESYPTISSTVKLKQKRNELNNNGDLTYYKKSKGVPSEKKMIQPSNSA